MQHSRSIYARLPQYRLRRTYNDTLIALIIELKKFPSLKHQIIRHPERSKGSLKSSFHAKRTELIRNTQDDLCGIQDHIGNIQNYVRSIQNKVLGIFLSFLFYTKGA
jgi:hypothetical protein